MGVQYLGVFLRILIRILKNFCFLNFLFCVLANPMVVLSLILLMRRLPPPLLVLCLFWLQVYLTLSSQLLPMLPEIYLNFLDFHFDSEKKIPHFGRGGGGEWVAELITSDPVPPFLPSISELPLIFTLNGMAASESCYVDVDSDTLNEFPTKLVCDFFFTSLSWRGLGFVEKPVVVPGGLSSLPWCHSQRWWGDCFPPRAISGPEYPRRLSGPVGSACTPLCPVCTFPLPLRAWLRE